MMMQNTFLMMQNLKNSTQIDGLISSPFKSPRFWGKCMAVCALLATNKAEATGVDVDFLTLVDNTGVAEHTHIVTSSASIRLPTAVTAPNGSTSLTYSLLRRGGTAYSNTATPPVSSFSTVPSGTFTLENGSLTITNGSFVYTPSYAPSPSVDFFWYTVRDKNGEMTTDAFVMYPPSTHAWDPLILSEYNNTTYTSNGGADVTITLPSVTKNGIIDTNAGANWLDSTGTKIIGSGGSYQNNSW